MYAFNLAHVKCDVKSNAVLHSHLRLDQSKMRLNPHLIHLRRFELFHMHQIDSFNSAHVKLYV